jgi:hypothetical protein
MALAEEGPPEPYFGAVCCYMVRDMNRILKFTCNSIHGLKAGFVLVEIESER